MIDIKMLDIDHKIIRDNLLKICSSVAVLDNLNEDVSTECRNIRQLVRHTAVILGIKLEGEWHI